MIKAIFFDLDGTLLNSEKKISPKTRAALEQCKTKGVQLFIATARPPMLDRMLAWDDTILALFDGGSYHNGGCTIVEGEKNYLAISEAIVKKTIQTILPYDSVNIALQLENEKHAFRFPLDDKANHTWGVTKDESLTLHQVQGLKTIKMLIFHANLIDSTTAIEESLIAQLQQLCLEQAQLYLTDRSSLVQIMGKSVNKSSSIQTICSRLNLGQTEVAVFGDDINDIEMISAFEYSFAMGNAAPSVKEKAKYVTLDNNNDGIPYALHQMLNLI